MADDSYYPQDPEDPTGDGILRYEDSGQYE